MDERRSSRRRAKFAIGLVVGLHVWGDQKATAQFSIQAQYRDAANGDFTPTAFGQALLDRGIACAGIPQVGVAGGGLGYISFTSLKSGNQVYASVAVANGTTLLTANHVISDVNWSRPASVGFGSDARNDIGPKLTITQSNIAASPANPTLDIAGIKVALPGNNIRPLTIAQARPAALSTLSFAGFGYAGSPNEGIFPQDGKARGGDAKVGTSVGFGYNPNNYLRVDLSPYTGIPLNIAGAGGTSGALLYNENYSGVGIAVASTVGSYGGTGNVQSTIFIDFTSPEVNAYVISTMSAPVPEPTTTMSIGAGVLAIGALARRLKIPSTWFAYLYPAPRTTPTSGTRPPRP